MLTNDGELDQSQVVPTIMKDKQVALLHEQVLRYTTLASCCSSLTDSCEEIKGQRGSRGHVESLAASCALCLFPVQSVPLWTRSGTFHG